MASEFEEKPEANQRLSLVARHINKKLERYLMVALLTVATSIVIFQVFSRFVLDESYAWVVPTTTYLYVVVSWIGAAYAVKHQLHLRMDLLRKRMPPRLRFAAVIADRVVFLFIIGMIIVQLKEVVQLQKELSRSMFGVPGVEVWWFYGATLLAVGLVALRIVQALIADVKLYWAEGELQESEAIFG